MAYTKEPISAAQKPLMLTPGTKRATTRNAATCRTSTRTPGQDQRERRDEDQDQRADDGVEERHHHHRDDRRRDAIDG